MPRSVRRSRARLNSRGLSEIVGTLMLVLIVVAAATAFSFFVASYEQTLLAQENANHQRALESLHVLSVQALPGKNGSAKMSGLNITLASGDVNPMQISDILVNGNAVISYNATYISTRTTVHVGVGPGDTNLSLNLSSLEEAEISLDLAPFNSTNNTFSSFLPGFTPTSNSYLVLNFQTSRGNNFNA
ncbi:MAG TPA: archaellin/type IV pilin N-terminal domain-containing protein, partial [Thermoplasmata archaeon]|nr:archaellin/type IV pilin N-terminal domain-containing protein [Thermoplasmata archaeon]